MADISKVKLPNNLEYNFKDSWLREHVGELPAPYSEVEWVESNGQQYVYLDWRPSAATWGFEADFIIKNAFSTTVGAWAPATNVNGYGNVFGTRNASTVNDFQLGTYGTNGLIRYGGGKEYSTAGILKTDKTRQTVKLIGTTLTKGNGTTATITRGTDTANKPYQNMCVFCMYNAAKRCSGTGSVAQPGTVRIYSLKFYENTTLKVDLVGAIRKSDGATGLYDKVAGHFYPAIGMTYGSTVGDLGTTQTLVGKVLSEEPSIVADNTAATRLWRVSAPTLDSLVDGQAIVVTPRYNVASSTQTTELADWDDTGNNAYVYLKLTLSDGTVTDWVPSYYAHTTRLTSHYGSGMPVRMVYKENCDVNTSSTAVTSIVRGWFCDPNYDTNTIQNTGGYHCANTGAVGVWATSLFMEDGNGTYQNVCTASDGTVTSSNRTTGTTKKANANGFKVGGTVFYTTTTYAANAHISGNNVVYTNFSLFDSRYSLNTSLTAGSLTAQKPVYLVGTIGNDGLYYLDTVWWTQTPTTQGKVYVLIGGCYDSTTSNCRIDLYEHNPWYVYDGTRLVEYDDKRISDLQSTVSSISGAYVSGVKGNAESSYRTGNVNITHANLGTTPVANGGTGATTADAAWTALGGGAIGKKASLAASDIPELSTDKLTSGTLGVARGGTGKTTGKDAANYFMNALDTGSSTPVDADYYISQYVSGGTTTTTYHRRPMSALWNYIKGKISSVLGLSDTSYGGNSATATKLKTARTINVGNYASGTAQSFDGSANITIPVNSLNTTALVEPSIVKAGTKTSLPLVDTLKGNKLALLPADQIIIEKTTDGGTTWVDYGATDEQKRLLFVGNTSGSSITVPLLNGVKNVNCGIRITFTAMKYDVPSGTAETGKYAYWNSTKVKSTERYCSLQAFYFWVGTNSDGLSCKCEKANGNNANTWTTVFNKDTTEAITGWSGGDYITFSDQVFGGGTTQVGQAWNWRFTFFTRNNTGGTTLSTSNTGSAQQINRILGYGANGWNVPNQLFGTGHLYSWDTGANATFPASIKAGNGYLQSTNSGNTVQIGSQNAGYCHISNSASIPFWFNNSIYVENGKGIGGSGSYGPAFIEMNPANNSAGNGGYIDFHYNKSTSDYTARLIEDASGQLSVYGKLRLGVNAQNAITNAGIVVNDVRNATITNNIIDQAANFYFSASGTPDTNWWSILHVKGWTGAYAAWELAGPANNSDQRTTPLYVRTGNASNTWGSWRKLLDGSMLSSATNSSAEDVPATPKAVKAAYDLASGASTAAGNAMSVASGAIYFKVTYSISGSNVVCAAHVYVGGQEVTTNHADSCFVWSMSLNGGTSWTSLGTGKTKTVSAMTTYGGNVKCDFTPAS